MEPLGEGEDEKAGSELIAYAEAASAPADFKKPRRLTEVAIYAPFSGNVFRQSGGTAFVCQT